MVFPVKYLERACMIKGNASVGILLQIFTIFTEGFISKTFYVENLLNLFIRKLQEPYDSI